MDKPSLNYVVSHMGDQKEQFEQLLTECCNASKLRDLIVWCVWRVEDLAKNKSDG